MNSEKNECYKYITAVLLIILAMIIIGIKC